MTPPHFDVTPQKERGVFNFLSRQLFFTPEPVTGVSLAGKTAIVTGSNAGVGLEVSRQLLDLGLSKLIMAVRNEDKGHAASANLPKGRDGKATIEVWKLGLASYDSIVAFAQRAATLERMDIAVMNAGLVMAKTALNESTGHDETIQVNYISTALLTVLLLPVAKAKRPAQGGIASRITLTSSDVATWTPFKEKTKNPLLPAFDTPGGKPTDRMMVSKLLGQFFLAELAKRVPPSAVVINYATPGMVHDSQFNREIDGTFGGKIAFVFIRRIGYTSLVAARHITDAIVKHGEESHGQYLSTQKLKPMAPIIYSDVGKEISER
ncbi:hypothetical protein QQS21_003661 [Conoideocrella luteorostrata]|uniref:Short-chain dehydrogenase/reductase family protein n=1 Tax=Conoideocrella luteorostrata TaxID=1105319 RepID=A0AAJ0CVQ5_9HYPO|nr:hypothetical protein QQS21_003661 [Conoideocrella luteorostrata]